MDGDVGSGKGLGAIRGRNRLNAAMLSTLGSIASLYLAVAMAVTGLGLLGTLLVVRAGIEGYSTVGVGVLMATYFLGYAGGTLLWPPIVRRVGHVRAFSAMAALASAAALVHALLVTPWAWFPLRLLTGLCMVGIYVVVESWLNTLAPGHLRARLFAQYMMLTLGALALGQLLVAGADPRAFQLFAVASLCFSLSLVPIALSRGAAPQILGSPRLELRRLAAASPLGLVGAGAAGLASGAFWGLGPTFVHGLGLGNDAVAGFMGMVVLGGLMLQWPVGWMSDRFDRRRVLAATCAAAAAMALLTDLLARRWLPGLYLGGFLYGGLAFSVYALSVAHVNDRVGPGDALPAAQGLLLLFGVGAALGPLAAGAAMSLGGAHALPLYLATVLAATSAFALYRMALTPPVPAAEQGGFVPLTRTSSVALDLDPRIERQPELDLGGR